MLFLIFLISFFLMVINSKNLLVLVLGIETLSLSILFLFSFSFNFFFFVLLILIVCGGLSLVVMSLLNMAFFYKSNVSFLLK